MNGSVFYDCDKIDGHLWTGVTEESLVALEIFFRVIFHTEGKTLNIENKEFTFDYDGGYYKEIGDFLKENYLDYGFTKGTVQEVDFLVQLMDLPPNSRILDIGCGTGRHSLELARRGFRTLGVDISAEFIQYATRMATPNV